jgi:predicted naringenin-chalcone synthase
MSFILDISTAVPDFSITKDELVNFYSGALQTVDVNSISRKLAFLSDKTKIENRYSCIPDFNGGEPELYIDGNFKQPIERRTEVYKEKIMPLAAKAIDKLLLQTNIETNEITHLITVSCTGLFAPGFEFLVAEHYGLQHTEKSALNFLGCYAAIKALKYANYIAQSDPNACVLIVSAELCSLHFYPSSSDEDIIANLLFADGAAAVMVCGNKSKHQHGKVALNIDAIGSAYLPDTLDLMTWNITSSAFRMYLSKYLVKAIKDNIEPVVSNFLSENPGATDYWAIHPGGVGIVQAVKESLHLTDRNVADSLSVLQHYGNMSSPTILFILKRILNKLREAPQPADKKVFACAFGPGLNIEMIYLSSFDTTTRFKHTTKHAVQV